MEKSKKESEMHKEGHIAVNQKEVLEDHFEKREIQHPLTIAITGIRNTQDKE